MQQRHMNWIVRVKDSFPARNVLGKRVCEAWLDVCHAGVRCQSCQWEPMSETWNCDGFSCHLSLTLEAPKREPMRTMGSAWPGTFAQIFHFRKASPADITEPVCCWTWADLKKRTVEVENQKPWDDMGCYLIWVMSFSRFWGVVQS